MEDLLRKVPKTKKELKIYSVLINKIVSWLKQKINSSNSKGITLGISGGIDSSTLALISELAFPNGCKFYYLKTENDSYTESQIINLSSCFKKIVKIANIIDQGSIANTKSRLFMTTLYGLAFQNKNLVLGTDNFDEYYLGYFTKYGDGGCDLLPFANIKKSDVYAMASLLGVPQEIIDKKPSATLYKNQYDEEELGFKYSDFEKYLLDPTSVSKEYSQTNWTQKKSNPQGSKIKIMFNIKIQASLPKCLNFYIVFYAFKLFAFVQLSKKLSKFNVFIVEMFSLINPLFSILNKGLQIFKV